jgi:hypothetical protein
MTKANTPSSSSSFPQSSTERVDTVAPSRRPSNSQARRTSCWVIAPTPVAAWVTGPLQTCYRGGHRPTCGEPPCAWRWPARLWTSILTSYSRPGDRVLITDAGNGIAVRTGLSLDRQITARVPNRTTRADLHLELLEEHSRDAQRQTILFDDRPWPSWRAPASPASSPTESARQPGSAARGREGAQGPWPQHPVDLMVIAAPCPADDPHTSQNAYRSPDELAANTSDVGDGNALNEAGSEGESVPQDAVLAAQVRLLSQRAHLVRAGGLIVVLTRITPDRDGAIDRLGPLIEHARSLGLRYLQHVPVLHTDLRHGQFTGGFGPDDPAWSLIGHDSVTPAYWQEQPSQDPTRLPYVGPVGEPHLHMPIHSDVVVFQVDERTEGQQHELAAEDENFDGRNGLEGRTGAGAQ